MLLALIFLLAAAPISRGLFGHADYQGLVRLVALVQMGIAWANLLLAVMKGFRDAAGNALSLIIGSVVGVAAWYLCYWVSIRERCSVWRWCLRWWCSRRCCCCAAVTFH
jgi:antigen flippase